MEVYDEHNEYEEGNNVAPRLSLSQLIFESSQPEFSQVSQPSAVQSPSFQLSQPTQLSQLSQHTSQKILLVTPKRNATPLLKNTRRKKRYGQLETQSEADRRVVRKLASERRRVIRLRWKHRKIDLREEEDTNDAFKHLAHFLIKNNFKFSQDGNGIEELQEWEEGKGYWESGHVRRYKLNKLRSTSLVLIKKNFLPKADDEVSKFPVYRVKQPQRSALLEPKGYYPIQHATKCPVDVLHFHRGTIARLAVQYLLSCRGEDEIFEDKLLKILFQMRHNSRSSVIGTLANELGSRIETYLNYEWKDKAEAAKALGISYQNEFEWQAHNTLTSLRTSVKDNGRKHVHCIIRNMSKSKIDEVNPVNDTDLIDIVRTINDGEPTIYEYIKGSIPPVPQKLLDNLNIVFGKEDPNSQMVISHYSNPNAKIDSFESTILLSTLVSRLAYAQQAKDYQKMEKINRDIVRFLDMLRERNSDSDSEAKGGSVLEYETLMQCCMYFANSVTMKDEEYHQDIYTKQEMSEELSTFSFNNTRTAADKICTLFQSIHRRKSLKPFPRLHLIHALCLIFSELPPIIADTFARNKENPVLTIKHLLEFLETNDMLEEIESTSDDSIGISHLQGLLWNAAAVVEYGCVTSTSDIEYDAWLVALRLGILLLKSGIEIGYGSAHLFPSYKVIDKDVDDIFSEERSSISAGSLPHEVRIRSKDFTQERLKAAETVLCFIEKADRVGNRGSGLITSLLEWSQILALLLGPTEERIPLEQESRWKHIRRLHAIHKVETIGVTLSEIDSFEDCGDINKNTVIDHLASNLEKEPRNTLYWRCLVKRLGHLGHYIEYSRQMEENKCENCEEHELLSNGFLVDHNKKKDEAWWGHDRRLWWKAHLLNYRGEIIESSPHHISAIIKILQIELNAQNFPANDTTRLSFQTGRKNQFPIEINCEWLTRIIETCRKDGDKMITPEANLRKFAVNKLLPNSTSSIEFVDDAIEESAIIGLEEEKPSLEIECYKILLMGHLCGVNHKAVGLSLWHFSYILGNLAPYRLRKLRKDTLQCLRWLKLYGIDPILVLEKYCCDKF